jgi:gamma-glutamylcyclotransferase (GGCT)/AIG2-like uncharacterized protein YtfP
MTALPHALFVYGTLAPGRPNAHQMAGMVGTWEPATARGELLSDGWGAAAGYPAIVLADDGPEVPGFVFRSADLPAHWARLDDFEGKGYRRVVTSVRLASGDDVLAFVYALRR